MGYIIASSSGEEKYIHCDSQRRMSITSSKDKAEVFVDSTRALNTINNSMSKDERKKWMVVQYEKKDSKSTKVFHSAPDSSVECICGVEWDSVCNNITNSYSQLIDYRSRLQRDLGIVNAELCDCEHACEFFKCDAARGYRLYAMIRERRIKRRHLKNELMRVSAILDMGYSDIANGCIKDAFRKIDEQVYEPRVLKELFSDMLQ